MPDTENERWFLEHVHPHEPALRAFLYARFPSLGEHDDVIQEAYSKLLRAHAQGIVRYPRGLLFTAARNAAIDLLRRKRVANVEEMTDFKESSVLAEAPGAADFVDQQHRLDVLADAVKSLPERCRQVMILRYSDKLPHKEIAARLGISPETVKVHMAAGIRRCSAFFAARGLLEGEANTVGKKISA
jgi:RNA polymerase sigma-70 factor (ECF subfamily)